MHGNILNPIQSDQSGNLETFVIMTLPLGVDGMHLPHFPFQYTAIRCAPDRLKCTARPHLVGMVNMGLFSLKMLDDIAAVMTQPGCVAIAAPPACTDLVPADHYKYVLMTCPPKQLDAELELWEVENGYVKTLSLVAPEMLAAMRRAISSIDVQHTGPLN